MPDLWCAEGQREQHRRRAAWLLPDRTNAFAHRAVPRGRTRSAHHQSRRPPAPAAVRAPVGRGFPGTMGGADARRRHDQFLGEEQLHGIVRPPARHRTFHARRARPNRLRDHHQRLDDVDEALDGGHPAEAERRALVRVRVPRRQLRNPARYLRCSASQREEPMTTRLLDAGYRFAVKMISYLTRWPPRLLVFATNAGALLIA